MKNLSPYLSTFNKIATHTSLSMAVDKEAFDLLSLHRVHMDLLAFECIIYLHAN